MSAAEHRRLGLAAADDDNGPNSLNLSLGNGMSETIEGSNLSWGNGMGLQLDDFDARYGVQPGDESREHFALTWTVLAAGAETFQDEVKASAEFWERHKARPGDLFLRLDVTQDWRDGSCEVCMLARRADVAAATSRKPVAWGDAKARKLARLASTLGR